MMGTQHAACGAAAWVVVASDYGLPITAVTAPLAENYSWLSWLPEAIPLGLGLLDAGPEGVFIGALLCAGAAMLPDIDHHNASIAHSLPPLTMVMARFFQTVSGGHRQGTHSIVGILFFGIVSWIASFLVIPDVGVLGDLNIGAGLIAIFLSAFAFRVLRFIPDRARKTPWAAGIAMGVLSMLVFPAGPSWLITCVVLGVVIHIVGDMLTKEGCNLLWPLTVQRPAILNNLPILADIWGRNGRISIPLLRSADSVRAWALTIPISCIAVVGMAVAGMLWMQQIWVA